MPAYRLYCLERSGHIVRHTTLEAEDDTQAIALVELYDDSTDRELWQDRRKVIVIPAKPSVDG
jgi:hypothetical protein